MQGKSAGWESRDANIRVVIRGRCACHNVSAAFAAGYAPHDLRRKRGCAGALCLACLALSELGSLGFSTITFFLSDNISEKHIKLHSRRRDRPALEEVTQPCLPTSAGFLHSYQ